MSKNNSHKTVYLIDDDLTILSSITLFLHDQHYQVEAYSSLADFKKNLPLKALSILITDMQLHQESGLDLQHFLQAENIDVPILFLTARSLPEDKLAGFAVGADDYLTKPFSMEELLARIEAISRRAIKSSDVIGDQLMVGNFLFEPQTRMLHLPSGAVKLTTKENQLLSLLAKNKNEIIDRQATLRAIWGDDNYFNGRSMDVYIAKLRKLLKEDPSIEIMNVHGKGFQLIVK